MDCFILYINQAYWSILQFKILEMLFWYAVRMQIHVTDTFKDAFYLLHTKNINNLSADKK